MDTACTGYENGLHRAGWVVQDPWNVIANGYVRVASGKIRAVGSYDQMTVAADRVPVFDHGPGVLIPALINAHTHLELSGLQGKVDCTQGFGPWLQAVLALRETLTPADLTAAAESGLREMAATGTGVLCEISSLGLTADTVARSGLAGFWALEMLGNASNEPATTLSDWPGAIQPTLAGHAPHTTAPALLADSKQAAEGYQRPFSIHVSESDAEVEFIVRGQGDWAEFLTERGIDYSNWNLPARSPIAYLDTLGLLNERTLAVHVLQADTDDLDILQKRQTPVCVCPRSNLALHGRLPAIPDMLARNIPVCLGTDSLASTPSLNLFDEMAFVAGHYPALDPAEILAMATAAGAVALRQPAEGRIATGCRARMIYVPVNCATKKELMETLIHIDDNNPCRPLFAGADTTADRSDAE